jgi:hypothetical protein
MSVLASFYEMAALVAPEEFSGYMLEQPDAWPTPVNAAAYCNTKPMARQRDYLKSTGVWHGHAPIITFVDDLCESFECQGQFLHELAHVVPQPEPRPDIDEPPSAYEWQDAEFLELCSRPVDGTTEQPWIGHDAGFIRRGLHIHFRAVNRRWLLTPGDLCLTGEHYGTSDINAYLAALGDEPDRCRLLSFAEIETIPAPESFTRLFVDDVARWQAKENS